MTGQPKEQAPAENLWHRLRRRKVVQWGLLYVAGAWGFLQGLEYLSETFHWPEQFRQISVLALLLGLPIALVVAWYHGDRGEQRVRGTELIIIALLFLAGGGILWLYDRARESEAIQHTAVTPAAPTGSASTAITPAPDERSIAVLPFVDMSPAKDQEYMSDGIAEELLNLLAKVPDLKVIARTSSFAFKGKDVPIAEIATALNVANVLEGSVRTSGTRLRVTAQLIRTSDSTHMWSETYERTLEDAFAVQDDIAGQVVNALKVTLLSNAIHDAAASHDAEAYNDFLQGRYFARRQSRADYERATGYLRQSLARDPDYAPAWVELANVQLMQADFGWVPFTSAEGYSLARDSVQKALALDAKLASAHAAMAYIHAGLWDFGAAEQSARQAVALEPGNADVLVKAGVIDADLGRLSDALALIRRAVERDPLNTNAHDWLASVLVGLGQYGEAEIAWRKILEIEPTGPGARAAVGYTLLLQGNPEAALHEVELEQDEPRRLTVLSLVYYTLGRMAEADMALTLMKEKYADDRVVRIAEAHAWRGEYDLAFDWLERAYRLRDPALADIKLSASLQRLVDDPRYKAFVRKLNLPT